MRLYSLVLLVIPCLILRDSGCVPKDLPLTRESLVRINARYEPNGIRYAEQYQSVYNLDSEAVRMRGGLRWCQ